MLTELYWATRGPGSDGMREGRVAKGLTIAAASSGHRWMVLARLGIPQPWQFAPLVGFGSRRPAPGQC
jgi:hypothetical protein